jgi:hypothetical protein
MRICPYFSKYLVILPLFWNQTFGLNFDIFENKFDNKIWQYVRLFESDQT